MPGRCARRSPSSPPRPSCRALLVAASAPASAVEQPAQEPLLAAPAVVLEEAEQRVLDAARLERVRHRRHGHAVVGLVDPAELEAELLARRLPREALLAEAEALPAERAFGRRLLLVEVERLLALVERDR